MSPTVLRRSGPDIERDGRMVTPRAMVSTCEVCGQPAHFGDMSSGKLLTFCREHNPDHLPLPKERNVA